MPVRTTDYYGALVGWTSQDFGQHLVLQMQSVTKPAPHAEDDIDSFFFMVDKTSAVLLANYLFALTQQSPPQRKRGWLGRFLRL